MDLISRLSPYLFWDTDPKDIDPEKHRRWIIERVLMYGTLPDFRLILQYYGWETIGRVAKNSRQIDCKTASFIAAMTGIPKKEFFCYTYKFSNLTHWEY